MVTDRPDPYPSQHLSRPSNGYTSRSGGGGFQRDVNLGEKRCGDEEEGEDSWPVNVFDRIRPASERAWSEAERHRQTFDRRW